MAPQIERLKRDSKELKHFMFRLEKEGKDEHAHRMRAKLEYLNSRISDIEEDLIK